MLLVKPRPDPKLTAVEAETSLDVSIPPQGWESLARKSVDHPDPADRFLATGTERVCDRSRRRYLVTRSIAHEPGSGGQPYGPPFRASYQSRREQDISPP